MKNPEKATPNSSRLKIVIIILAVLLILSAGGLAARYVFLRFFAPAQSTVAVPDNILSEEDQESQKISPENSSQSVHDNLSGGGSALEQEGATGSAGSFGATGDSVMDRPAAVKLELYDEKPGGNRRFEVNNMFPGDTETGYFCIKTYHDTDLELFFRTKITEQTKNLGKALRVRVTHLDTGKVLCDAPFAEITGSEFPELLTSNASGETTAYYRIDVTLDTSVGNEYQSADLKADFEWYVKEEGGLIPSPQTGDAVNMILWVILTISSALLIFFLLLGRRRKGDERHE